MSLPFEINRLPEIAVIAVSGGPWHDKMTVGGFAIETTFKSGPRQFLGIAAVRDTNCLFAIGLARFAEKQIADGRCSLTVFALHSGFEIYLTEHVPTWLGRGKRTGDGKLPECFRTWKYLYALYQEEKLRFIEEAEAGILHKLAVRTHELAKQAASVGESLWTPGQKGLLACGQNLADLNLEANINSEKA